MAGGLVVTELTGRTGPGFVNANEPVLNAVDCMNTSICVAVGNGATARSTDGGSTWTSSTIPSANTTLLSVSCPSTTTCVSVGVTPSVTGPFGGQLLVSSDGGTTWKVPTSPPSYGALGSVACPTASFCVAVGAKILVSTNGGQTWSERSVNGGTGVLRSVACSSASTCLAIGGNPGAAQDATVAAFAVQTTDGGATWSPVAMPAGSGTLDVVACVSGRCEAAGSSFNGRPTPIFRSANDGKSWTSDSSVSSSITDVSGLTCVSSTSCVFVGHAGQSPVTVTKGVSAPVGVTPIAPQVRTQKDLRPMKTEFFNGAPYRFFINPSSTTVRSRTTPFTVLAAVLVSAVLPTMAGAAATTGHATGTRLYVGRSLAVGGRLTSPSGVFTAVVEPRGQIEIQSRGRVVWRSGSRTGLRTVLATEANGDIEILAHRDLAHLTGAKARMSPSYLSVENDGDLAVVSTAGVPIWQAGLRANLITSIGVAPYAYKELYGGSNPSVVCYTCQASNITGTAPPSNALDSSSDVDALTGDYSTSNTLFDAPAIGGDLSLTLSYDAELAQSEIANGVPASSEPFGVGWSSNFSDSMSQSSTADGVPQVTVDQGNGSEVTFTESNDGGTVNVVSRVGRFNGLRR